MKLFIVTSGCKLCYYVIFLFVLNICTLNVRWPVFQRYILLQANAFFEQMSYTQNTSLSMKQHLI